MKHFNSIFEFFSLSWSFEKVGGRCCVLSVGMCECKTPTTEMSKLFLIP